MIAEFERNASKPPHNQRGSASVDGGPASNQGATHDKLYK